MNAISAIWSVFQSHGTRILGIVQGSVALLCGMTGLIPDSHMKYWLAASALLTFWRGQVNANTLSNTLPAPQPKAQVKP